MIVLVCGGQDYADVATLERVLDGMHGKWVFTRLVHGNAPGADRLAGAWAAARGITTAVYPANWRKYGRAAGSIRNEEMLEAEKPWRIVAFPGGAGTYNMITRAHEAGVRVLIVTPEGEVFYEPKDEGMPF